MTMRNFLGIRASRLITWSSTAIWLATAVALSAVACSQTTQPNQMRQPEVTEVTASPALRYSPGDSIQKIESSGVTRTFVLHIPPAYRGGDGAPTRLPLVIALHGYGSRAEQMQ